MNSVSHWLSDTASRLQHQVRPVAQEVADRLAAGVHDSARTGTRWMNDGRDELVRQSSRAARRTMGRVRHRPMASLVMAAATGAALYALATRLMRTGSR